MAATEHSRPNRHEICDGVVSIADELLLLVSVSLELWEEEDFLEIVRD